MREGPAYLFHGGCHGCTNDISVCPTCKYMTCNRSLPDMNPASKERENKDDMARQRAWDAYNVKNNPEKIKFLN